MPLASTMSVGVYVHFPYCRKRCPYCDFAIHVRRTLRHVELADAVIAELQARADWLDGRQLVSIYLGGGTPSLWEPACVARVVAAVRVVADAAGGGAGAGDGPAAGGGDRQPIEVTLEANPDDLPGATLEGLRAAGVNRLSIGAQSMSAPRLAALGRDHRPEDVSRAVAQARAAGFTNLSLDLIYGLPGQDRDELHRDVDALLALGPEHLSAYQLTIEERTPLGARQRAGQPQTAAPDEQADLYAALHERCGAAGLVHYEVSSFARPGFEALHNALYWSGHEWLGLGPAAHSFRRAADGGERWANPRNIDRYLARWLPSPRRGGQLQIAPAAYQPTCEILDGEALAREAMWLGLRQLRAGVDRRAFSARFGVDPATRFAAILDPLAAGGAVIIEPERIRLTARGALLADEVGLRFL